MELSTGVHRRRRRPGEMPTAATAIRNHCLECVGYDAAEVRRCTAPECWLYPWRFGKGPATAARVGEIVDHGAITEDRFGVHSCPQREHRLSVAPRNDAEGLGGATGHLPTRTRKSETERAVS